MHSEINSTFKEKSDSFLSKGNLLKVLILAAEQEMVKTIIAYILPDLLYGGAQQHITLLCTNLDKSKYKPVVICLYSGGPFISILKQNGIKVIQLAGCLIYTVGRFLNKKQEVFFRENNHEYDRPQMSSLRSLFFLLAEILSGVQLPIVLLLYRVNLISIHLFCLRPSIIAAKLVRCSSVYTEHGVIDEFYYTEDQINQLKKWMPKANSIIAVSQATKASIINRLNIHEHNINVIGHSVSFLTNTKIEGFEKDEGTPIIAILSRMVKFKGHECFIRAAKLMVEDNPKINFQIASWGELRPKLEDMIVSNDLMNHIKFTGKYKNEDLPILLKNVWIVVVPSTSEALGIVAIEAMSCGVPVVASNTGGLKEIIKDGENGFLVPPDDHIALANALLKLINNPNLRRSMGNSAMDFARTLTPKIITERTSGIYKNVLN
jgi:glycosyltransferase involved in cell wall biosynthesis